jgi:uncharacterized membrane protein YwaF
VSSFSHPFLDWRTFISFQICGINNILLPLVLWFDWKKAKDFVFASSILGGIAAILYPSGILYGDPLALTLPMIRSLVVHFLFLFLPLYMIRDGQFRFDPRKWPRLAIGTLAAMAWATFGNLVADPGANNMYIMHNPFYGGPIWILNILPDGWHIPVLLFLIALGFLGIYLLQGWYDRHQKSRTMHPARL